MAVLQLHGHGVGACRTDLPHCGVDRQVGRRFPLAWLQLDRHARPAGSILNDGRQCPSLGGHSAPILTLPPATMGTLAALAAELAERSDAELRSLLLRRPDAMTPPVPDFASLAARLSATSSINIALDQLNMPQLQSLAALLAGNHSPRHAPFLPELHKLALLIQPLPVLGQLKHDAGTHPFLPVTAVAPALSGNLAMEGPLCPLPPVPEPVRIHTRIRDNAAASSIDTLLRDMATLLNVVSAAGVTALRGGHVGTRALHALIKSTHFKKAQLCFYLELAADAGLITLEAAVLRWHVTAEGWLATDRTGQWIHLAQAWLSSGRPSALGRPGAAWRNRVVIALEQQTDPLTTESLLSLLAWRHPRQSKHLASQLTGIVAELEMLGFTGAGALSGPGDAAAKGDWGGAATRVSLLLPVPIEHFVIQGDLTAIAPGFLAPAVAAQLKLMAVPEGHGTAGIYRFNQESLETAITAGMEPSLIFDFLRRHSSTAVPQSLGYLITAAARKAAVTHGPAYSSGPVPMVTQPDTTQRAKAAGPGSAVVRTELSKEAGLTAEAEAQIAQLRSQPLWAEVDGGESGTALVMEQLRAAIAHGGQLRLHTVDNTGALHQVVFQPLSLEAGMLRARLPGTGHERRLNVHRVLAAEPVLSASEPADYREEQDG